MQIEKIIHEHGSKQPFSDTVKMLLSNCVDYGNENGGFISAEKYGEIEMFIKKLMEMAWDEGRCSNPTQDFDQFIKNFPNYCY